MVSAILPPAGPGRRCSPSGCHRSPPTSPTWPGTGSLTALAAEIGHRVLVIDLAENMVARARAKTAIPSPWSKATSQTHRSTGAASTSFWPGTSCGPDPQAALRRWTWLVRPGGRLLLVEGRWWSVGDADYDDPSRMPWSGGVRAADR